MSLKPAHICNRCEFAQKDWKPPLRLCVKSGKDIIYHAEMRICPMDFFAALRKTPTEIEAELERQGYNPQTSPQSPMRGSCCDPPKE